ncbi:MULTISPECIES: NblA/ycf18 family protein [Nostocales]|uniref:Phycobilisome degradation family protein n=3 Tax=Nostocales TaxID=1161 RepID=A0A0C1MXE9_9CYAN|nr:NblA/ycf18 family protein [Tolypothrix bouteillei]KAF3889623.1 phycobilisome degradation family protein [Tolypothrix bouteillei VB521301]
MNKSMELSLEQQFNLRIFEDYVRQMSREQAQDFLIEMQEHMMLKENMYKTLLKQDWGISADQIFM